MPDPRMLVAALDNALNSLMRQVHRQATISFQEAAIEFQPSRRTTSGQAAITDDNIRLATLRRQNTPRQHVTAPRRQNRSEEHTSELQSLMRISYAVFCLQKKKDTTKLPIT